MYNAFGTSRKTSVQKPTYQLKVWAPLGRRGLVPDLKAGEVLGHRVRDVDDGLAAEVGLAGKIRDGPVGRGDDYHLRLGDGGREIVVAADGCHLVAGLAQNPREP